MLSLWLVLALVVAGLIVLWIVLKFWERRCRRCKKLWSVTRRDLFVAEGREFYPLVCKACGYEFRRSAPDTDGDP